MGLPGDIRRLDATTEEKCEYLTSTETDPWTYCDVKATVRVQGETDSFGAEYAHYCDAHLKQTQDEDQVREDQDREERGDPTCEWCKKRVATVQPYRDPDEGMAGSVYYVCRDCRHRSEDAL